MERWQARDQLGHPFDLSSPSRSDSDIALDIAVRFVDSALDCAPGILRGHGSDPFSRSRPIAAFPGS